MGKTLTGLASVLMILGCTMLAAQETRGVWVPTWEMKTPALIAAMVAAIVEHNGNEILAAVRYRGDAAYVPNRSDRTHPNPEPRNYMIQANFDPLDYLVRKAHENNLAVVAWFTMLVATPHELDNVSPKHVWYTHRDWFTHHANGRQMTIDEAEGAFLDPGVPEVQDYLVNIVLDVVANYDGDGVQFDYIRYPGGDYGWHPVSRERWRARNPQQTPESWQRWRQEQVSRLVRRCYAEIKAINPNIVVSASVVADLPTAQADAQDWPTWLCEGWLDTTYLMSYQERDTSFERVLNSAATVGCNSRIVVGLRAWPNHVRYPVEQIISKVAILRRFPFAGMSLFSYGGLIENGYYDTLRRSCFARPTEYRPYRGSNRILLGHLRNAEGKPVEGAAVMLNGLDRIETTDAGGFFAFFGLPAGDYQPTVQYAEQLLTPPAVTLDRPGQALLMDLRLDEPSGVLQSAADFTLEGFREPERVVLSWSLPQWTPLSVYRRQAAGNGLFELVGIVLDSTTVWADDTADRRTAYEYKLITGQERSSNVLSLLPASGEHQMRVQIDADTEGYLLCMNLPLADKLAWSLEDATGHTLLAAEGWYPGGRTVERWNGVVQSGGRVAPGVYRFRCSSTLRDWSWETRVFIPDSLQ